MYVQFRKQALFCVFYHQMFYQQVVSSKTERKERAVSETEIDIQGVGGEMKGETDSTNSKHK